MAKVNLDAIVPREDFEVEQSTNPGKKKETLSIEDIKSDSFFFSNVRKPDFQRETNEWDGKKIADFIDSFLDGDLIPAVILWRSSGGFLFVIDGSHRLSSLAAWINDDYGDGTISKNFYDGIIPEEQRAIGDTARTLIRKRIGSYADYKLALTNPEKVSPTTLRKAKNLAALAIQLQWVEGDASKAEASFFKINQQAAPINTTELVLLESRKNLIVWLLEQLYVVERAINIGQVFRLNIKLKFKSLHTKLTTFYLHQSYKLRSRPWIFQSEEKTIRPRRFH